MSETTTTTGWHRHEKTGTIHQAAACFLDDAHPVIWLDPADPAVRETIARAVSEHLPPREILTVFGDAWAKCSCGEKFDVAVVGDAIPAAGVQVGDRWLPHVADVVLAALASATEGAGA